jgi:hypothetical protein
MHVILGSMETKSKTSLRGCMITKIAALKEEALASMNSCQILCQCKGHHW